MRMFIQWYSRAYVAKLLRSARDALAPLMIVLDDVRECAHRQLTASIDSRRFRSPLYAWMRFVSTRPSRNFRQPVGPQPLCEVAPWLLATSARRVVRVGQFLDHFSEPAAFYDLRTVCKNLR